jgi:hypothetical protein
MTKFTCRWIGHRWAHPIEEWDELYLFGSPLKTGHCLRCGFEWSELMLVARRRYDNRDA